jgi:enediyne biosynthesis protein E4
MPDLGYPREVRWLTVAVLLGAVASCTDASVSDGGPWSEAGTSDAGDASHPPEDAAGEDRPSLDAAMPSFFPTFTDVTASAGLDYLQWAFVPMSDCTDVHPLGFCVAKLLTGGAALGDYDGDGWDDLYVTRLDGPDILYRNQGDGTFVDVTGQAGLGADLATNGAVFADVDDDGHLDLYVTTVGEERFHLYVNNGDGTFTEATDRGVSPMDGDPRVGMGACVGDYDRDGWLDLHVSEWIRYTGPSSIAPNGTSLYRNRGAEVPGAFEDVTGEAGVDMVEAIDSDLVAAFVGLLSDIDRDGWLDLLVVSDIGQTQIFWNQGDGSFLNGTPMALDGGPFTDENGMDVAAGDFDLDGRLDLFVTSIFDDRYPCSNCNGWGRSGNRMYRNLGHRQFTDATDEYGVRDGGWGWGTAALDYDNDGDLDLVMTNGYLLDVQESAEVFHDDPMRLWRNEGELPMAEVAQEAGLLDTGSGKALLVFDYDRDGDLDLFVVNNAGEPKLYRNDGPTGNHLRIRTEGRGARDGGTNLRGLGAWVEVRVHADDAPMVREMGGCTFLGQNENVAHFGLGEAEVVHEVRVVWPVTGEVSVLSDVDANQLIVVREPD